MLTNLMILLFHVTLICSLTLIALRFGRELLTAWLAILAVAMNLFVLKQITLFGLNVTSSDALAVGYLLGLNLTQEFYGRRSARQTVWISFFVAAGFILLSQFHLAYTPNSHDQSHLHFIALFRPMPRVIIASFISFLTIQLIDLSFFAFLRQKTDGKFLALRVALALILSQTLDTLLFSFLGLYGLVASISHIIIMSLVIKAIVILLSTPFVSLSKRIASYEV